MQQHGTVPSCIHQLIYKPDTDSPDPSLLYAFLVQFSERHLTLLFNYCTYLQAVAINNGWCSIRHEISVCWFYLHLVRPGSGLAQFLMTLRRPGSWSAAARRLTRGISLYTFIGNLYTVLFSFKLYVNHASI